MAKNKNKFKMPTLQEFYEKKKIHDDKKDPVWVYLEREMVQNDMRGIKPYNETVGVWLRFLRDLRYYYHCQAKRRDKRLAKAVGPSWFCELSTIQREVLHNLKSNIHQDLLEDLPKRTYQALKDLGLTLKIPKATLMTAMVDSIEDSGLFIWNLYKAVYKKSPSELRRNYDMNAIILMSSLVFIDLEECIDRLEKLTYQKKPDPPEPKKKRNLYYEPKCRYGEYLQKIHVPFVCNYGSGKEKRKKPLPLEYKLQLRSEESYETLCNDTGFLEQRKERNQKATLKERVCTYKFWEAPRRLGKAELQMGAYGVKLRMVRLKAKPKFKAPFKNVQYQVVGVSFTGGSPHYILSNVVILPTGFIPVNGGLTCIDNDCVTNIHGYARYPRDLEEKCQSDCLCLGKWEEIVLNYLKESKCKCGHLYDYCHPGTCKEKYFYPPNRHGPFWLDNAKIYQLDPMEDFIKETVENAVNIAPPQPEPPRERAVTGVQTKDLLAAFLADLSDTPLLIPHLPQACLLNNLQEWVRRRMNGKLEERKHKKFLNQSERSWLELKHVNFKAGAYKIPFTYEQIANMKWSHRYMIQDLFLKLLDDFMSRNRLKQLEQTRLWWPTTKFDVYPSKPFLDIFFTYMPGRMQDTFLINPYSSMNTPKYGAKTCPIGK